MRSARTGGCVSPEAHVNTAQLDDEAVLLNIETGDCYTLNRVGAWLWTRVDGTKTAAELVDALVSAFDVSRERAELDVYTLVDELVDEGLAFVDGKAPAAHR